MYKEIINEIKKFKTIIISRHSRPDLDALGSQLGLKQLIEDNFKDKKVYAVGDMSKPCFLGQMDEISSIIYQEALLIICDTCVKQMLPDIPYLKAKKIICIDHHKNDCDIENATLYTNINAAAASQIIATLAFKENLIISKQFATCVYSGIISDTNRFNFSLSNDLFKICAKLIDLDFDYSSIYNIMYSEKISNVKMKAYFTQKFKVNKYGVAYLLNKKSIFEKFPVDFFSISRGMVHVMSNLENVHIWCNFTQDPKNEKVVCEFRSKKIVILDIAKKYGGGGHPLACGATVENFEIVKQILQDFNKLIKEQVI